MSSSGVPGSGKEEENLEVGFELKLGEGKYCTGVNFPLTVLTGPSNSTADLYCIPVFNTAQVLVNTEVSEILNEYEKTMKAQEGGGYTPNPVFQATREYVDRFKSLKTRETANAVQKYYDPQPESCSITLQNYLLLSWAEYPELFTDTCVGPCWKIIS